MRCCLMVMQISAFSPASTVKHMCFSTDEKTMAPQVRRDLQQTGYPGAEVAAW